MTGYPPPGSGYPYGQQTPPPAAKDKAGGSGAPSAPPNPYAQPYGAPPPTSQPYGAPPPTSQPYGAPPPAAQTYGAPPPTAQPYGAQPPTSQPYGASAYGAPPPTSQSYSPYGAPPPNPYGSGPPPPSSYGYQQPQAPYGAFSPFAALTPSVFPPGTDPNVVACFQAADRDGSGQIDDKELQGALSSYNQSFSIRTVHLLMYLFTGTNVRRIGPKEFTSLFYSLQNWRATFERFDRDRSGKIDANELREALLSLGFSVSQPVLDLLISKFDKTSGKVKAVEYDNFIECCLTVKGLTEKFKEKDSAYMGSATFTYEAFMLSVLPFLVA